MFVMYQEITNGLPGCAMDRIRMIDSYAQWDILPTIVLYVAYSVVMVIVLLNLIIAVFNDTYSAVIGNAGMVTSVPLAPKFVSCLSLSIFIACRVRVACNVGRQNFDNPTRNVPIQQETVDDQSLKYIRDCRTRICHH